MRIVPTAALIVAAGVSLAAQDYFAPVNNPTVELLWPNGAPGALGSEDADKPTITIYLPSEAQATGMGIVVYPGGGYHHLAMDHEGHQMARWLTSRGIAAFIAQYRLGPRCWDSPPAVTSRRQPPRCSTDRRDVHLTALTA